MVEYYTPKDLGRIITDIKALSGVVHDIYLMWSLEDRYNKMYADRLKVLLIIYLRLKDGKSIKLV